MAFFQRRSTFFYLQNLFHVDFWSFSLKIVLGFALEIHLQFGWLVSSISISLAAIFTHIVTNSRTDCFIVGFSCNFYILILYLFRYRRILDRERNIKIFSSKLHCVKIIPCCIDFCYLLINLVFFRQRKDAWRLFNLLFLDFFLKI